jgi:type I restriction enzyme R subunit
MSKVGQIERETQNRIVAHFKNELSYKYLGNWEERANNRNIEESLLTDNLIQRGYPEQLISKTLYEINKIVGDQSKSLYDLNKEFYSFLRYGVKVKPSIDKNTQTVELIDWKNPEKNQFGIAEEVSIEGENTKRPDIVLYVNGIALGVLELKRSTVTVSEGIRQNLDNQQKRFIRPFFNTIQLVMAGNDTEGLRYATIETPEKYYLTWKEDGELATDLDLALSQLCNKKRFLELIHNFLAFDAGTKKICRHNQYFGIKAAQDRLRKREGGIIWHTQGSGKSLTMVWLSRWIRENITDSRVLVITDRTELDEQIEGDFTGTGEKIYRCTSGADLIEKLNSHSIPLLCSLIHKFGREEESVTNYIEELRKSLPKNFKAKGDVYVFVDECHRTQSGVLHDEMKEILPNAVFVGFTGTPLLKKDKQKSIEIFGSYIHTYKFDEAVKDGVVLDLRYEARDIDQDITSPEKIDQWFAAKTKGLNDLSKMQLKQRWGTLKKVFSARERLERIVADVLLDMETKDRLLSGRGNAMLVTDSIYQACRVYEMFLNRGFTKCAIVTSYAPSPSDIKGEETGEGITEKLQQYDIYKKMLDGKDADFFESEVKKKFIDEPGQMKLLIVVDKLLTGFDAPAATYLYIDKTMQDHGLFQAICRVNRLDGDDKEYGYIVDYKDLFKSLEKSIEDYTTEAFDKFDKEDVEGLLKNRLEKAKERLESTRESIKALCEPVEAPKDTLANIRYFCGKTAGDKDQLKDNEQKRLTLYKLAVSYLRAYASVASEMDKVGYSDKEAETIKAEVEYFEDVRTEVKLASGDYIDLKAYEPAMRHLIDSYIKAEESQKISTFDDMSLVELIVERGAKALEQLPKRIRENKKAVAETIENNVRRVIVEQMPINPKYYESMSKLFEDLIEKRRKEAIKYEDYLKQIVDLTNQIQKPETSSAYPNTLDTAAKRALYDNLGKNEGLAIGLDSEIRTAKKDDWRGDLIKERIIRNAIRKHVDEEDVDRIFDLVKSQRDY